MHKRISVLLSAVFLSASLALQAQPNKKKPAAAKPKKAAPEKIYENPHTPPQPPMSGEKMSAYFAEKTESICYMTSFTLNCVVNKDGSLSDVWAREELSPECQKAIRAAALKMPKWKPGRNAAGKPIRVRYTANISVPRVVDEELSDEELVAAPSLSEEVYLDAPVVPHRFETRPEFPDLNTYIRQNLVYPAAALKAGTSGSVRLRLFIEPDGKVNAILALSRLPNGCTEEAVRLAKNMPAWKPGTRDGKPVRMEREITVQFTLPADYAPQPGETGKAAKPIRREVYETEAPAAIDPGPVVEMDPVKPQEEDVYEFVEEQPQFPGDLQQYIRDNLRYPQLAKEAEMQGKVIIRFVVEKDGSLTDIKVVRGIGMGCDEEALRVVKNMPKWKPGKQNGKPVKTAYMLPVKFQLK